MARAVKFFVVWGILLIAFSAFVISVAAFVDHTSLLTPFLATLVVTLILSLLMTIVE